MEQTHFLTAEEKEKGFTNQLKHTMWNGLGFSFLTDTIIYLMALNFSATNVQLGFISSTLYLSGLVLLAVPQLLGGLRLKSIYFWSWLMRGLISLAYLSLLFLEGQAAIWVLMITYTLFCLFRTLGAAAAQPIIKNMMSSSEEGRRLIQLSSIFNRSSLISRTISFAFLSIGVLSGIKGLVALSFMGVITNTISSLYLRKLPSRERVEKIGESQGILKLMAATLKDRDKRYYLIVIWLFVMANVLNGFIIPFLRNEGGIPSNLVFLYTMLVVVGGLLSNAFIKPYIDKTGTKPLLILVMLILGGLFVIWALIPPEAGLLLFLPLGMVHSFFMSLGFNLTNRLFYKILPSDKNRLNFSSMNSFAGAIIALLTGLEAGKIADFTGIHGSIFHHSYSLVFLIAAAVVFLIAQAAYFLKDRGSISLKEASEVIFFTRNRRVFLWSYQLSTTEDPQKRESTLLSLEKSRSDLADREMINQLHSPYSWEKERILRSLFKYPRPALAPMVKEEASDPQSYNRRDALFALASYPGEETEIILNEALEDPDPQVVSMALKSLTRLDHDKYHYLPDEVFPRISHSPRAVNDWFISCCEVEDKGRHLKNLFSVASPERGYRFQQLIFCLAARYYGKEILLAPYYQQSNTVEGEGLEAFLEEMRDQSLFHSREKEITEWFRANDGESLLALMQKELPRPNRETPARYLREAVDSLTPGMINRSSFLALLYFSYQILRDSQKEQA